MIATPSLASMIAVSIITILGPVVLLVIWTAKKRISPIPALAGALTFMLFARILEMIPHVFFILTDNPVSRIVTGNPFIYALYAGLAAGIFEETGRFAAFKLLHKKYPQKETAVTYGIGHGGFEAMSIIGFAFLQYFMMALSINNGSMDTMMASASGAALTSLETAVTSISSISVASCIVVILERVYAMAFHIAMSVLVFHAVRTPRKKWLFPLAILLHAIFNFPAAFYQAGVLPVVVVELIGIASTVIICVLVYKKVYKKPVV